ncbi:hypothetical protein TVAG_413880 [Trichomonas vaginalis G3]|uniref:Surface antigen BspA-like n=1 Tax=Trichomonas vaginalis (strain ATCC PRA-98 / G3) TaxID=412133 RepID=A2EC61_TRIV3|nr:hypothetical protein TVAGG3_0205190 [Trichomonas vaginalis G3]EAY09738.1 hypothetical protein TVAG_413880 [Trichomonas vaginalis G3]KAI5550891.1 hypothetical protein TVAGG3_0205190 [Trichomonas vaginalis G3]|eukprot:XP_001321961.1 hypothetical protein [Trichomonas vaginalis G3]
MLSLSSVTNILGDCVFSNCTKLATLILSNLKLVSSDYLLLFDNCSNLKDIYFGNMPPNKLSPNISFEGMNIHVPSWENYISQSEEISPNHYKWHGFEFIYHPITPEPTTYEPLSSSPTQNTDKQRKKRVILISVSVSIIIIVIIVILAILLLITRNKRKGELITSQALIMQT